MKDSVSGMYALGFCVGIAVTFAVFLLIRKILAKRLKGACNGFDERQQIARGKASTVGFVTLCMWQVASVLIDSMDAFSFAASPMWHMLGLVISLTVFAVACIWNDAYFSPSPVKRNRFFVFLAVVTIINFVYFFADGGFKNSESPSIANFFVAVMLLFIMLNLAVKHLFDNRHKSCKNGDE